MSKLTRRKFLEQTGYGLAATSVAGWILRADATPTPTSPDASEAEKILRNVFSRRSAARG